jgi:hypothetical protein
MQKNATIVRKLPLPLEIRLSSEATLTDGLFSLSSKEASKIRIIDIDSNDKYATIEIYPPNKEKTQERKVDLFTDLLIGTELSKSRGLGKELGQYKYYRRTDGSFYVIIENASGRVRKLQIGNLHDRNSNICVIARTIKQDFTNEFSKADLAKKLQKPWSNGQTMKGTLDILTLEGYLERKQSKPSGRGRLGESFKATEKMLNILVTPEQA